MGSDFRFVPNIPGFVALRNSPEVQQACLQVADAIAGRAASMGDPRAKFSTDVRPGRTRCHAIAKQDGGTVGGGPLQKAKGF